MILPDLIYFIKKLEPDVTSSYRMIIDEVNDEISKGETA